MNIITGCLTGFCYLWDDLQFDKCFPSYYFGQNAEIRLGIGRSEDCITMLGGHLEQTAACCPGSVMCCGRTEAACLPGHPSCFSPLGCGHSNGLGPEERFSGGATYDMWADQHCLCSVAWSHATSSHCVTGVHIHIHGLRCISRSITSLSRDVIVLTVLNHLFCHTWNNLSSFGHLI